MLLVVLFLHPTRCFHSDVLTRVCMWIVVSYAVGWSARGVGGCWGVARRRVELVEESLVDVVGLQSDRVPPLPPH